jgi:hypothetical protein
MNQNSDVLFSQRGEDKDWLNNNEYACTQEDFCIFVDFPHMNKIVPILDSANLTNCTTTIEWLVQGYGWYAKRKTNHLTEHALYYTLYNLITYICFN